MLKYPWYRERLKICSECPLNSINVTNKKGWWYRMWNILNFKKPFCTVCGCEIKAKISEQFEKCSLDENKKWDRV